MDSVSPMVRPSPNLAVLAKESMAALCNRWRQVFGESSTCPSSREFLLYTLAWQLQAQQHGGLTTAGQRQLSALLTRVRTKKGSSSSPPSARLPIGTVLLRTWKGQPYRVEVVKGGFAFHGQTYVSLSEIARVITGTRWNGPAFFGLRRRSSKQKKASAS